MDIAAAGQDFLDGGASSVSEWAAAFAFERIVYLGTEALKGIAQESSLKMLELTRGQVTVLFDSPVGFRHGPKSFVNDETLVVFFLSDDPFIRKFELDLLREMSRERRGNKLWVVAGQSCAEAQTLADRFYCFHNAHPHENGTLAPEFLLVAQILAYNKSLALQIDPDNPNPAGIVNRVVQGVTIYPYPR
jgi:tagatose-6-phosphate ketose/aldose isomerase